jgi:hypothetical protein
MIDATALWFLGLIAVACIWRIHKERREHDRELLDQRTRLYQGGLF